MGSHEDAIPPNPSLYPEELQLKLYQAFIFSIPILFCIILFLLFYLFFLKRRANNVSSHSLPTQQSANTQSTFPPWNLGIKGELKEKLQVVEFDEELKARDSVCCVCLGEFEMKEELQQLSLCKHVFHGDCIRHWLRTNATCPLCRCPVIPTIKMGRPTGLALDIARHDLAQQQAQGDAESSSSMNTPPTRHDVIQIVGQPYSSVSNSY